MQMEDTERSRAGNPSGRAAEPDSGDGYERLRRLAVTILILEWLVGEVERREEKADIVRRTGGAERQAGKGLSGGEMQEYEEHSLLRR